MREVLSTCLGWVHCPGLKEIPSLIVVHNLAQASKPPGNLGSWIEIPPITLVSCSHIRGCDIHPQLKELEALVK